MLQSPTAEDTPLIERLRSSAGRRALGLGAALLIEALLILLLLSLGSTVGLGDGEPDVTVVDFEATEPSTDEPAPEPTQEAAQEAEPRPSPQRPEAASPPAPSPLEPTPTLEPRAVIPTPFRLPPAPEPRPARSPRPDAPVYGPADTGPAMPDTARVGTAPNGQPLYAASWYREPRPDELRGYLSTASGPGWGLIACRTAPDFRVEDCVGLDEFPDGSQITRAVLAAAWQFKVRPPRLGGVPQVGSWVRIRIDYGIERR